MIKAISTTVLFLRNFSFLTFVNISQLKMAENISDSLFAGLNDEAFLKKKFATTIKL